MMNMMRRRIMLWVCTVYLCHIERRLGVNGLHQNIKSPKVVNKTIQ